MWRGAYLPRSERAAGAALDPAQWVPLDAAVDLHPLHPKQQYPLASCGVLHDPAGSTASSGRPDVNLRPSGPQPERCRGAQSSRPACVDVRVLECVPVALSLFPRLFPKRGFGLSPSRGSRGCLVRIAGSRHACFLEKRAFVKLALGRLLLVQTERRPPGSSARSLLAQRRECADPSSVSRLGYSAMAPSADRLVVRRPGAEHPSTPCLCSASQVPRSDLSLRVSRSKSRCRPVRTGFRLRFACRSR